MRCFTSTTGPETDITSEIGRRAGGSITNRANRSPNCGRLYFYFHSSTVEITKARKAMVGTLQSPTVGVFWQQEVRMLGACSSSVIIQRPS
jgi:hypothetical protein